MARPTDYSLEMAQTICRFVADGGSVRKFCKPADAPAKSTVMNWLAEHREFRDLMAVAREMAADSHAEDTIDIADNEKDPAKARVRVSARQWYASKLAPKKYGDRLELAGQVTVAKPSRKPVDQDQAEAEWEASNPS